MVFKTVTVGIASDAIEQISKVKPYVALEELIWNAIDAEASRIEVIFYENKLQGVERIVVSDNGHGIPAEEAETIFKDIGGSRSGCSSFVVLLRLGPRSHVVAVDLDMDHVRPAADGAVLDVLLDRTRREVERDDDLLAARVADVAGFVIHQRAADCRR